MELICNKENGQCIPKPVPCAKDTDCPLYFLCEDYDDTSVHSFIKESHGTCKEAPKDHIHNMTCEYSDSECYYFQLCDDSSKLCVMRYCDYNPENMDTISCQSGYYCDTPKNLPSGEPVPYGAVQTPWPPKADENYTHPGECVKSGYCETDDDCSNAEFPVCFLTIRSCVPSDYPGLD